ncbi:MAG: ATPase, partial [Halorientalis sp.]
REATDGTGDAVAANGDGAGATGEDAATSDQEMMAAMASVADDGGASTATASAGTVETPTPSAAQRDVAHQLRSTLESMQPHERGMLQHYRNEGPAKPLDAHFAGGGKGDRTKAYAHNRTLRTHGFIEHAGRGYYAYRLPALVREECEDDPDEAVLDALVADVETVLETE